MRKGETERARVELKREIMPSVAQLVGNNGLTFGRRNRRGRKSDQPGVEARGFQRMRKRETERARVELKREIMPSVAQLVANNGLSSYAPNRQLGKQST